MLKIIKKIKELEIGTIIDIGNALIRITDNYSEFHQAYKAIELYWDAENEVYENKGEEILISPTELIGGKIL